MTRSATGPAVERPPDHAESVADIVEWLFLVFERRLGLSTVLATVHDCCRELDIDLDAAGLKRLERTAHRRLNVLALTPSAS
jgi:hypothetical protein